MPTSSAVDRVAKVRFHFLNSPRVHVCIALCTSSRAASTGRQKQSNECHLHKQSSPRSNVPPLVPRDPASACGTQSASVCDPYGMEILRQSTGRTRGVHRLRWQEEEDCTLWRRVVWHWRFSRSRERRSLGCTLTHSTPHTTAAFVL